MDRCKAEGQVCTHWYVPSNSEPYYQSCSCSPDYMLYLKPSGISKDECKHLTKAEKKNWVVQFNADPVWKEYDQKLVGRVEMVLNVVGIGIDNGEGVWMKNDSATQKNIHLRGDSKMCTCSTDGCNGKQIQPKQSKASYNGLQRFLIIFVGMIGPGSIILFRL